MIILNEMQAIKVKARSNGGDGQSNMLTCNWKCPLSLARPVIWIRLKADQVSEPTHEMILNQLIDTTKTFSTVCVQQQLAPLMFNAELFTTMSFFSCNSTFQPLLKMSSSKGQRSNQSSSSSFSSERKPGDKRPHRADKHGAEPHWSLQH